MYHETGGEFMASIRTADWYAETRLFLFGENRSLERSERLLLLTAPMQWEYQLTIIPSDVEKKVLTPGKSHKGFVVSAGAFVCCY